MGIYSHYPTTPEESGGLYSRSQESGGYRKAIKYRFPRANRSPAPAARPLTTWCIWDLVFRVCVFGIWDGVFVSTASDNKYVFLQILTYMNCKWNMMNDKKDKKYEKDKTDKTDKRYAFTDPDRGRLERGDVLWCPVSRGKLFQRNGDERSTMYCIVQLRLISGLLHLLHLSHPVWKLHPP